jgi:hypothetical protein
VQKHGEADGKGVDEEGRADKSTGGTLLKREESSDSTSSGPNLLQTGEATQSWEAL